ncbi:uncharacterized protein [Antedon mediterranea]|uniref:uncharacterized protein isoform X2 n=1 Tax=Antedon mediterranea TaxID=105859 RepID=UPI003AF4F695
MLLKAAVSVAVLLCLAGPTAKADSSANNYLIMAPKVMVAETTENVCIQLMNMTGPMYLSVKLMDGETVLKRIPLYFMEFPFVCLPIEVPKVTQVERFEATLLIYAHNDVEPLFTTSKKIFVEPRNSKTFIQTDKPIYKPGQTVKFRILTIDQNLHPKLDVIEKVYIEAPNGVRLAQWINVTTKDGLTELEFETTSEPILGTWKIYSVINNIKTMQEFDIDEYVLPKFEVKITSPSFILVNETNFNVKVCGRYTYGQPVFGNIRADVTVKDENSRYYAKRRQFKTLSEESDSNGCAVFLINAELFNLPSKDHSFYDAKIHVVGYVMEQGTGIELSATDFTGIVTMTPFQLKINALDSFKPGLPFFGKIFVTRPDGEISPNTEVLVTARADSQNIFNENMTSDSNGLIEFSLSDISIRTSTINIYAQILGYSPEEACYGWSNCDYTVTDPKTSLYAIASFSPSGSFVQLQPILKSINAGDSQELTIRYTWDEAKDGNPEDVHFRFLFMSRGNILGTELTEVLESASLPTVDSQPAPPDETQEAVEEIEAELQDEDFEVVLEVEEIDEPFDSNYSSSYPFYPAIPTIPIAEPGKMFVVRKQFEVTQEMAPITRILIYYIRLDGEVVADSIEVNVDNQFENKVDISFTEGQKKPGEATKLKIVSAADSLCAIGVVDKSVHLLRSNNQLTPQKVFSTLDDYQLSSDGGYIERSKHCPERPFWYRKKRSIVQYPSYQTFEDSSTAFENMGLVFMTNIDVETRPCPRHYPVPIAYSIANVEPDIRVDTIPGAASVRTYFPETWLWNLQRVSGSGELEMNVTVPDTITEWVGSGFCTSVTKGVGVSTTTKLTAFQPFFVSYTLPYSVVRGEKVAVKTTIFNYLDSCLAIKLKFKKTEDFELLSKSTEFVCVCGGQSTTIEFSIVPRTLGKIPLTMYADTVSSNSGNTICPSDKVMSDLLSVGDAIRKELLVEAEGIKKEIAFTQLLNVDETMGDSFSTTLQASLPENFIEGSESGYITLIGDMMGKTLNNLDNLLQMPTGCGEQNMLGFVPNIYVLQYLTKTDQVDPNVEQKALAYMKIGYQRELNYRRNDNSYSAFGNSDAQGSTWLTAFVVKSFAQASKYIFIDENDLHVSIDWLKSMQMESGCFRSVGKVLHSSMQGGVDNAQTLTAYIMIAMMESGIPKEDTIIQNAIGCVSSDIESLQDPYNVALMAYALTLADAPKKDTIIQLLNSLAIDEGGVKHWEAIAEEDTSHYYYISGDQVAKSRDVEATAYGLLALLSSTDVRNDQITLGLPVVQWITRQTNPQGGYISTQDTVMALQAIASFAGVSYSRFSDLYLDVQVQGVRRPTRFFVTSDNRLVIQKLDFPLLNPDTAISLTAGGVGSALVQMVVKYNVPTAFVRPSFDVSVDVDQEEEQEVHRGCGTQVMDICTTYNGTASATNMAVVEIHMSSGYYPDKTSLKSLVKFNPYGIKRYDIDGKVVSIYFDQFSKDVEVCFKITIEQHELVEDLKPGNVFVYDYYDTVQQGREFFEIDCDEEIIETKVLDLEIGKLIKFPVEQPVEEIPFGQIPIDAFLNECPDGKTFADGVKKCVDINECEQPDICPKKKVCINTNGSYKCKKACQPGFKREGKRCVDINECEVNPNTCPEGFICKNIKGDRLCEQAPEICNLDKEAGHCRAKFLRYYWNKNTKQCEQFTYGGCDGNKNNFKTIERCEDKCRPEPPANCLLEVETGLCLAAFNMFYYDSATKQCKSFTYGGCGGNGNRFNTYKDCQDSCFARKKDNTEKPGTCPVSEVGICVEHCSVDSDCEGVAKCCSNGCGHLCTNPVAVTCEDGFEHVAGVCVDINECETVDQACPQDTGCINNEGSYTCIGGNPFVGPIIPKLPAIIEPVGPVLIKEGSCPGVSADTVGICVDMCSGDEDCDGVQICCSNGCGHACMQPVCPPLCLMYCEFGNVLDENNCPICECKPDPSPVITDSCPTGFENVDGECVDIDECQTFDQACPQDGGCINTEGSFECVGGNPFVDPIEPIKPIVPVIFKRGWCPSPQNTYGICAEMCSGDGDCDGAKKCCSNSCGHACVQPEFCLPVLCSAYCEFGNVFNEDNCRTCECKPDPSPVITEPVCPPVCEIFCEFGNVLDENNCPTCECKPDPSIIVQECPPLCLMYCEFGNVLDENNCPICECKPDPSPVFTDSCPTGFENVDGECVDIDECQTFDQACPQDGGCINTEGSFECVGGNPFVDPIEPIKPIVHVIKEGSCPMVSTDTVGICAEMCSGDEDCFGVQKCCSNGCGHACVQPVAVCPPLCKMACSFGNVLDENNCPICECKPNPSTVVAVCPPLCKMACPFGNVLDENNCPICECKPDPSPVITDSCPTGFENVDGECVDIDECQTFDQACPQDGGCINTEGSFECVGGNPFVDPIEPIKPIVHVIKEGSCPMVSSDTVGICAEMCSGDEDCFGVQKCCSNGCGHACVQPVAVCPPLCKMACPFGNVLDENNCPICECKPNPSTVVLTHCQERNRQAEIDIKARGGRPLLGSFVPRCDEYGEYVKAQCQSNGFCFCVNDVGEIMVETVQSQRGVMPVCDGPVNEPTHCQQKRKEYLDTGLIGGLEPQCEDDGSYVVSRCHGGTGFCFCVDEIGEIIEGTTMDVRGVKADCSQYINVEEIELTHCQQKRKEYLDAGLIGGLEPQCGDDGSYVVSRCHGGTGFCFCVDEIGEIIEGTTMDVRGVKADCSQYINVEEIELITHCQQKRKEYLDAGLIGGLEPQCEDDGSYVVSRCHGGTGFCFCVDEIGEIIEGTTMDVRGVKADCSQYINVEEIELTHCQQKRKEYLDAGLIGGLEPQCEDDGSYVVSRCHGGTGFCFCVDEIGEIIEGTTMDVRGVKADCSQYIQINETVQECPPLCLMYCEFGNVLDENNCPTCECKPDPSIIVQECPPLCLMYCEFGNVLDENNCPTCECKPDPNIIEIVCGSGYKYHQEDNLCEDINECESDAACNVSTSRCVNEPGTFECECLDGYTKDDNNQCVDVNECWQAEPCGIVPFYDCVNTPGSYQCVCTQGFTTDVNGNCEDIDECLRPQCGINFALKCVNTIGSFNCECDTDSGFRTGADGECEDVDECSDPSSCNENSVCVNVYGGYTCDCLEGFVENFEDNCVENVVKEGDCPSTAGLLGICTNMCKLDSDCTGETKCCSNGCGQVCLPPVVAVPVVAAEDCPVCATDILPDDFDERVCNSDFIWSAKLKKDGSTFRVLRNQSMENPAKVPEGMSEILKFTAQSSSCLQQCDLIVSFETYDKLLIVTDSSLIANDRIELDGQTMITDFNGDNRKQLMNALKSCDKM